MLHIVLNTPLLTLRVEKTFAKTYTCYYILDSFGTLTKSKAKSENLAAVENLKQLLQYLIAIVSDFLSIIG